MLLKNKIVKARQHLLRRLHKNESLHTVISSKKALDSCRPRSGVGASQYLKKNLKLKNVSKNYTRAICNFILSDISTPYLNRISQLLNFEEQAFRVYIQEKKEGIKGIVELRALLIIEKQDTLRLISYKKAFQSLAESFIKYFAVNWVFSSKLEYKLDYLKCRHRLLRKIRNPALLDFGLF